MSDEEKPKLMRKLTINGVQYVDIEHLRNQILLLGLSEALNNNLDVAMSMEALADTLGKDNIYESYPKETGTNDAVTNIVSLFGDSKTTSITNKE